MNEYKRDTREKIVDSAIGLFKANPYDAVSVKDICDAAGVSRNSFYYYFENKEMVFDAIGDWISRTAKSRLLSALTANTAYQRVWEIYKMYLDVQLEMGNEIMNRIVLSRTQKGRSDYYSYIDTRLANTMAHLIADAQLNGEVQNRCTPTALLWTSYAVIRGVNIKWCFQWGESDIIRESMDALDTLFMPNPGFELK